jgi:hypothetical protein
MLTRLDATERTRHDLRSKRRQQMQEPLKVEHSMQFPGEVPDSEALMLPVLSMTKDGKQHRVSDVRQWVGDLLRLPAEARAELLPSGGESLFSNRVRWAIQYLKWAGALKAIEHSVYQITDRGQSLLEESPNGITAKTLRRFREFAEPLQGDSATNGRCCVFQPFDGKAQKISFRPNWICRDVVAVAVINPAEGLMAPLEKTVAFGVPKLVWFSTLKNSARNCRLVRSVMAVVLNSDASTLARPGPLYTPRPKFPYVPAEAKRTHRD